MSDEKNAKSGSATTSPLAPDASPASFTVVDDSLEQQQHLAALSQTVNEMAAAFQSLQSRNAWNQEFREAVAEIKQVARAIGAGTAVAGSTTPLLAENAATRTAATAASDRTDGPCSCNCVDATCCEFEIVLDKIRVNRPQIEPVDIGDIPLLQNALEIRFYVTADGFGFMFPGFGSTIDLRADGLPPGPGPWTNMDRVINRIRVKKGTTRNIPLYAQVEEDDSRLNEQVLLAGKSEIGEKYGTIALNCCMEEIFPPFPLEVPLNFGGEGRGEVVLAIFARRTCC